MKLIIESVYNGYIIEAEEHSDEDGEKWVQKRVFEIQCEKEVHLAELENFKNLIYYLQEYFGVFNSKHNKYNLEIKINETKT